MRQRSRGTELLALQLRAMKMPTPIAEHVFHESRKWRFDLAWIDEKVACEIHGYRWRNIKGLQVFQSRHATKDGLERDLEKMSAAAIDGWCVICCSSDQVRSGVAVKWVAAALTARQRKSGCRSTR